MNGTGQPSQPGPGHDVQANKSASWPGGAGRGGGLGRAQFIEATADLDFEVPPQLELLERYTRYFIDCGYYDKLPSGPHSRRPNEAEYCAARPGDVSRALDERLRFDGTEVNFAEAYYVLWNDRARGLSMVVRYVLHNGILEQDKVAEVWCAFRDRNAPENDIAIRQRYPIGRAELVNTEELRLQIGPCGYGDRRAWGEVRGQDGTIS